MGEGVRVAVLDRPVSLSDAAEAIGDPSHGAQAFFCGTVRNSHAGRTVIGLSYDAYDGLAEKVLREICGEARGRWGAELRTAVFHSRGRLDVGDMSVAIGVSSPHRDESFLACRYIIEELKKRAPIWKQEHYVDGDSEWLQGHSLCGS